MKHTYAEFLDILDWELQQEKQGGDTAQADKFRYLPHTQARRIINETIKELVLISQDQFEREYTYTVPSENMKQLRMPDFIVRVLAYWCGTTEQWQILGNSSDLASDIVSVNSDTIYKSSGWSIGEKIKLKVVAFPHELIDNDIVSFPIVLSGNSIVLESSGWSSLSDVPEGSLFETNGQILTLDQKVKASRTIYLDRGILEPTDELDVLPSTYIPIKDQYIRLLILEVKRKVYARKGKAISTYEYSELMKLKAQWSEETSPIIAFEGYGLGR